MAATGMLQAASSPEIQPGLSCRGTRLGTRCAAFPSTLVGSRSEVEQQGLDSLYGAAQARDGYPTELQHRPYQQYLEKKNKTNVLQYLLKKNLENRNYQSKE